MRQGDAAMNRFGLAVVVVLAVCPVAAPAAPILYEESISGDLSDAMPSADGAGLRRRRELGAGIALQRGTGA